MDDRLEYLFQGRGLLKDKQGLHDDGEPYVSRGGTTGEILNPEKLCFTVRSNTSCRKRAASCTKVSA